MDASVDAAVLAVNAEALFKIAAYRNRQIQVANRSVGEIDSANQQ